MMGSTEGKYEWRMMSVRACIIDDNNVDLFGRVEEVFFPTGVGGMAPQLSAAS